MPCLLYTSKLHISGKETWYYLFTVIRTFVLVVISMYFDRADSVRQAFHMMKQSITQFAPAQDVYKRQAYAGVMFFMVAFLVFGFCFSVCEEKDEGQQ